MNMDSTARAAPVLCWLPASTHAEFCLHSRPGGGPDLPRRQIYHRVPAGRAGIDPSERGTFY